MAHDSGDVEYSFRMDRVKASFAEAVLCSNSVVRRALRNALCDKF